jgi:hypothetical protein
MKCDEFTENELFAICQLLAGVAVGNCAQVACFCFRRRVRSRFCAGVLVERNIESHPKSDRFMSLVPERFQ